MRVMSNNRMYCHIIGHVSWTVSLLAYWVFSWNWNTVPVWLVNSNEIGFHIWGIERFLDHRHRHGLQKWIDGVTLQQPISFPCCQTSYASPWFCCMHIFAWHVISTKCMDAWTCRIADPFSQCFLAIYFLFAVGSLLY